MFKKIVPALLVSSTILFNSSFVALASQNDSQVPSNINEISSRKLAPHYCEALLNSVGYPINDVNYLPIDSYSEKFETAYIIAINIKGRTLLNEHIKLLIHPLGSFRVYGTSCDTVNELLNKTEEDWNNLVRFNEEQEKYTIAHNYFYQSNVYVDYADIIKTNPSIAYVDGQYVPCNTYKLIDRYNNKTFTVSISSFDKQIVSDFTSIYND